MKKVLILCLGMALFAPAAIFASPAPATLSMSSSDSEIDDLLTDFEKVVNEYVTVAKKAQDGDMAATMKLATISVKMTKIAEDLAETEDDMTEKQAIRYAAIVAKMSKALM